MEGVECSRRDCKRKYRILKPMNGQLTVLRKHGFMHTWYEVRNGCSPT